MTGNSMKEIDTDVCIKSNFKAGKGFQYQREGLNCSRTT